jgi:hypothetical protein
LKLGTWDYVRMLPAAAGKTYALRPIVYGDTDVLVAFRVLRKDADDSVVLLWKVLKQYPKPALTRDATAGS